MGVETSRLPTVAFARPSSGIAAESGVDVARALAREQVDRRREIFGRAREHAAGTVAMQTEVREAFPVEGILAAIGDHQPDLVVMGTHGRGALSRLMFGSVARAVLRASNVPVVTIAEP